MSLNRYGKCRDANEKAIIEALREAGAFVVQLDKPLDLLVGFEGAWHLIEVKVPNGRLTPAQDEFFASVRAHGGCGPTAVVRTATEVLQLIGAKDLNVEIGPKRPAAMYPAWPTMSQPEGAD